MVSVPDVPPVHMAEALPGKRLTSYGVGKKWVSGGPNDMD
jgi:hypothetical protein